MLNVIQFIFKHAVTLAPAIAVILIMLVLAGLTAHIDRVGIIANSNVDINRLDHIAVSGVACQAALFSNLTQQLTHEYSTVHFEACGWQ